MSKEDIYILGGARTPIGRFGGAIAVLMERSKSASQVVASVAFVCRSRSNHL